MNFLWRVYFEPHRDIGNIGFVGLVVGLVVGVVKRFLLSEFFVEGLF